MKTQKIDIRPYTRQFYHKNIGLFLLGMLEMLLTVVMQLVVSWMLQQILDLMGGNSSLTPVQLAVVTAALILGIVLTGLLSYYAKPKFITRGISQYKTYIFEAITRKNISAFSGENSSVYISALTNDIQAIEQGYLLAESAGASTVQLIPVWRLSTDTGEFFVHGITGEVSPW